MTIGSTREYGTIVHVSECDPDHAAHYVALTFEFGSSQQAYIGPVLDDNGPLMKSYYADLMRLFGVSKLDQLKGRQCFALRCFGGLNEPIEGLEVDGRRFTNTAWRRKHFLDTKSVLERRKESLQSDHAWALRRAAEALDGMRKLESRYVDWERTG